jgi:type IV secretory pathway VirB4 component
MKMLGRLVGDHRRNRGHQAAPLFAPDAVEVNSRELHVGDELVRSFAVTGWPREVRPGWLEPLLTFRGRADVSLHILPMPNATAAARMRRQRARLESSRRADAAHGRLSDPELEVAVADADDLARRIARGDGRLFRVGLYVTVRARTDEELDAESERLRNLAAQLLLDVHPTTFRALQGWVSTLPLGVDLLKVHRTMDTAALAVAFPFGSAEMTSTQGVLFGHNSRSGGLIQFDRFAQDNYNMVVLGASGAGKSYFVKLTNCLRSLYEGIDVYVIDPEDEYRRVAEAIGGVHLPLGTAGVRLNPFDLYVTEHDAAGALTRRALFIHTLVAVLLGETPDPATRAALDRGIIATYNAAGITADPRTHRRPAPLLRDLATSLEADDAEAARTLAARLEPFTVGTHRELFDGPTSARPDGHLVVFSLRDLADELKAVGTLLTLETIWRRVADPAARRRRIVNVDEAWLLMRDPAGAAFLFRLAKSARKHWCGLTVSTQDAADLLGSELGQAVVTNAATHVLLHQAPQTIEAVARAFRLSQGERAALLSSQRGEGLLIAGGERAAFRAEASPAEHALITTDPAELSA